LIEWCDSARRHGRAGFLSTVPACLAGEPGLQIGKPNVILPLIAADRSPIRTTIITTVDQETANAGGAHFGQSYFLRPGGHTPLKRVPGRK